MLSKPREVELVFGSTRNDTECKQQFTDIPICLKLKQRLGRSSSIIDIASVYGAAAVILLEISRSEKQSITGFLYVATRLGSTP
jgi:hypothetical protein